MNQIKITLAKAVIKILSPLIRILLRHEVSHSEFSELAKRAYVSTAYEYFTLPNRKQTYARVAVLTGLSRKEVVRLSQLDSEQPPANKGPLNRATRVLSGWLRDPDFLQDNQQPRVLPLRGEDISFEQLVARYSGDISARAILDELIRVGAVTKLDKNTVKIMQHGYIPQQDVAEKIDIFSTHVADLLNTAVHNLEHEKQPARFQREVIYHEIPVSVINEFKTYSHEKSLALLIDFDRWLSEKKKNSKTIPDEKTGRVGVGIYYFQNEKGEN